MKRCTGWRSPGLPPGIQCCLDENHDEFCKPYTAPNVDEFREMQERIASAEAAAEAWQNKAAAAETKLRRLETAQLGNTKKREEPALIILWPPDHPAYHR